MASQEFGAAIAGLTPGITYHFRVVATNAVGTSTTPDQTFSTPAASSTPGGGEQTPSCDVAKLAQSAHSYAAQEKRLRQRGLVQRANEARRKSKRLSAAAKRCRGNLGSAK